MTYRDLARYRCACGRVWLVQLYWHAGDVCWIPAGGPEVECPRCGEYGEPWIYAA